MANSQGNAQPGGIWRSAISLGLVAILGTGLLAGVNQLTRERIAEQERRAILEQLGQVIPPQKYDNALHEDYYSLTSKAWFPTGQTVTAYRARMQTEPVAVVLKLAATDGYNGNIHLLVGIYADGRIGGVRVSSHKETPGLGDDIEMAKSDWVLGFDGRSLEHPVLSEWSVRRDGGEFDQFTGATITPRAVVKAVRQALEFFAANKTELFQHPGEIKKNPGSSEAGS
jgi:electron transport complex protein RnfG